MTRSYNCIDFPNNGLTWESQYVEIAKKTPNIWWMVSVMPKWMVNIEVVLLSVSVLWLLSIGDLEQVRVFFYHVMTCRYLNAPMVAVAIAGVWPQCLYRNSSGNHGNFSLQASSWTHFFKKNEFLKMSCIIHDMYIFCTIITREKWDKW